MDDPTFRHVSKLDHFLLSQEFVNSYTELSRIEMPHDHHQMVMEINSQLGLSPPIMKKNDEGTDWQNFKLVAEEELRKIRFPKNRNLLITELENCTVEITEAVGSATKRTIPVVSVKGVADEIMPDYIEEQLLERRRLSEAKSRAAPNTAVSEVLKKKIKIISKNIEENIRSWKNETWRTKLTTLQKTRNVFDKINKLTGRKKGFAASNSICHEGEETTNSRRKVEVIKNFYQDLYRERIPVNHRMAKIDWFYGYIEEDKESFQFTNDDTALNPKNEERFVNSEAVKAVVKSLNNKKSAGEDGMSNKIIKKLPDVMWEMTTVIFNNCLAKGHFPSILKKAIMIPIAKVNGANTPKQFRPISLLSNRCKLSAKHRNK